MSNVRSSYPAFHRHSINQAQDFWNNEASRIDWHRPFDQVVDESRLPFVKWFVGGQTNLCYNAVDRHLKDRAHQDALIYISTETNQSHTYSYKELYREVNRCAAVFKQLGVVKGDRILIYMPMVPQAVFAMLACVRLGAIHSVVFGGFAAQSLATRIDDAKPKLIFTADAGLRAGKAILYKGLVDEAIRLANFPPEKVVLLDRGIDPHLSWVKGRDLNFETLRENNLDAEIPVQWLESSDPSYILYTSGTTGKPKGVQRDTGGYAVALAASMEYIYCAKPGQTMFTTSDIGWVVGHSYIVYGPLIHGMSTILYEGLPIRPDPGIWWKIVEQYKVSVMFSSPTAIRVLKRQEAHYLHSSDVSSLQGLYLAGEPLDEPTARWISEALKVPVYDHYWQTETGWAILSNLPGVETSPLKWGSPGFAAYGFNVKLLDELTGAEVGAHQKGVVTLLPPLPPGCLTTVWGQDQRFIDTYFTSFKHTQVYTTFDWAIRDEQGYYFILGRSDDVINVAGHRLGTREIEEAVSSHDQVAEVAVVGVSHEIKGQVPLAFVVVKDASVLQDRLRRQGLYKEVLEAVNKSLGPVGRPEQIHFVSMLPKTRSGKILRRSIKALAQGEDPGDLTTLEDMLAIEEIRRAVIKP